MKYYVYCEEMTTSGANFERFAFDKRDDAVAKYHFLMNKCINAGDIVGCLIMVKNSAGGTEIDDKWGTMIQPVTPETEE